MSEGSVPYHPVHEDAPPEMGGIPPVSAAPDLLADLKESFAAPPEHVHEWSALWSHFGPYGDQDAHFHVCLTENPHPAPGFPAQDCTTMLVGAGRDCVDGQRHEVRVRPSRERHG